LAAINIITREPLQDQGTQISATRGDLKTQQYYLRHNNSIGNLDYRISVNYHKNNGTGIGFKNGDLSEPAQSIEDGGEISQFNFRGTYTPSLSDSLDIQLGYSGGQIGTGRSQDPSEFATRDLDSHFQSLIWTKNLTTEDEFSIRAYHNYLQYDQSNPFIVPANFLFGGSPGFTLELGVEDGVSERYDIEAELIQRLSERTRSVLGAGIRYETLKSQELLNSGDTVEEWLFRTSANLEHQLNDRWVFNVGAMLENNDLVGSRLSPRLGINYHINQEHSVRGSISRAYRTPSLLEANEELAIVLPDLPGLGMFGGATYNQISQPASDLGPEKISTLELGYLWQDLKGRWIFDTKLYLEEVSDGIDEFQVTASDLTDSKANENRNTKDWQTAGLELQLKLQPWPHSWLHFAYAYADAKGEHNDGNGNPATLDDRVPTHTLALLASHEFSPSLQGSLAFYRQTSVEWKGGDTLDPYSRLDARVEKGFSYASNQGSIELILQNLLSSYTEFSVNNDVDSRAFVRLNLNFQ